MRLGTLFAVRFDPGKLETQGLPVPVLDDVAANLVTAAGRFDFSAATGTLAYARGKFETVSNRAVWLDKSGKALPAYHGGTPSPDGRLIAYAPGGIGSADIRVWDSAREMNTSITANAQNNQFPVWAPDGRHLVYSSSFNGVSSLWWARADGGSQTLNGLLGGRLGGANLRPALA